MTRGVRAVVGGVAFGAALCGLREVMPKRATVRPLTVQVVDADSGSPLPGIRVHRMCETERYSLWSPMEPSGNRYLLSTFQTDADGRVRMPRLELAFTRHEYLRHENLYVNLDVAAEQRRQFVAEPTPGERLWWAVLDASSPDRAASVVTPDAGHRGAVIYSVEHDAPAGWQAGAERPRHDVVWNGRGLTRREESLVVRLRKQGVAP